jgi:hypothetical protein
VRIRPQGIMVAGAFVAGAFDLVRKTPLFAPFIYKNDLFTKTGSVKKY